MWGAVVQGGAFYRENGSVEIMETVFALAAALIFLLAARQNPARTPCSILLAGFLFCIFIRESDDILDTFVFRHAWKAGVTLVFIFSAIYAIRHEQELYISILGFINRPSFGIFMSGLLVLIVFSRLFGYGPFWKAIMNDGSFHMAKRVTEEGVEQMGYFLVFISSCEYLCDARTRR